MKIFLCRFFLCSILCLTAIEVALAQFDPKLFSGMKARSIGPAGMSGRIADIDAVAANPDIIFVGASIGGVWKSVNGGTTWKPVFDDQPVTAVGDVTIFQPNPSIVWVGTGEGNPRNSASVGNGVYKSIDGGETWTHMGLDKTERIHRILLHPSDENIAYVAAMGHMWGENPDRGVYKTTDGGKTWRKVLFVNEKVGCAELVMDPSNPNKLFAAMWEYRRWPWFFKSGGPGSGLYVTHDGGETWTKITDEQGFPKGELGRIGLAISKNNPNIVYALIEAKKNGLYKSEDGGKSWKLINESNNVAPRPFYYCDLRIDPQNENRIYSLHSNLQVSSDGGKTFTTLGGQTRVHSDHHALWIHPNDGSFLIDGNDGGVYMSHDYGATWRMIDNLPLAQFYHINVDMEIPYNIFGGMQDNGSWRGPSEVWENNGIRNWHWNEVGFGDGFATLVDASNPDYGYAMSQGGFIIRFNWKTGERKDVRPAGPDGVELRFNWNAGIAQDPFDPKTIYYGSQFVHKSTDRGDSWEIISPDLTTNDRSKQKQDESGGLTKDVTNAENHTTILTIAPSPRQQGVLWVGTDDGNVQVTRDGGKTWTNVIRNIPGVPPNTWVPHIEASKHDAGTAYVVFDDHRRSNWATYVYKTTDYGRSWTSLTRNDPTAGSKRKEMWGYALVLEEDPVNKNLLYLGTEFGLWVSFNGGVNWMKWTHGVPTASAMALIVHPRDHDLVIGTHGRAAYVLDDVRPLRTVTKEALDKPLHMFEIPSTYQHYVRAMDGYHFPADAMFKGENRPYGALITYSLNIPKDSLKYTPGEEEDGEPAPPPSGQERTVRKDSFAVRIEVLDESGKVIRKFTGPAERGLNRAAWNLRTDGPRMPRLTPPTPEQQFFTPQGPEVLPGKYTIKIKAHQQEATQVVEVKPDPRINIPIADRQRKFALQQTVAQRIEVAAEAVERIVRTRRAINAVLDQMRERNDDTAKGIRKAANDLRKKLTDVADVFLEEPNRVQGLTRASHTVAAKLSFVARSLGSSWDPPTSTQMTYMREAEQALSEALKTWNKVFAEDVAAFRKQVEEARLASVPLFEPLDMEWKKK
ncbi:MAG TPA: hypothetical protein VNN76_07545 [Bacteroidota bacterium]|nr:hypothetical protein [Bacteroidota bacterium]